MRIKNLWLPILVAVFSQLYFYPFSGSSYRISVGIVVLNFILLSEEMCSPLLLSCSSGVFTVLMRSAVYMMRGGTAAEAAAAHLPTLAFYFVFGALAQLCMPSRLKLRPVLAVATLMLLEFTANIAEVLVRQDITMKILEAIIITALVRTVLATLPLEIYLYNRIFITENEHQKRYEQLNLLISDIYAEAFYLKKSAIDIDEVMAKSYKLYDQNRESPAIAAPALEISRTIHEVGKDYSRLQKGLECLISGVESQTEMQLSSVLHILSDNTHRGIIQAGKHIKLNCRAECDCAIVQYYALFSVLGNLISNAIDACGQSGEIELSAREDDAELIFTVKDSGDGIAEELLPCIFGAGFTTKYNRKTGEAGTGIGLCHVKNIVEGLGGQIEATTDGGAVFTVRLPKQSVTKQ